MDECDKQLRAEYLNRNPAADPVDQMLLEGTKSALAKAGIGVLEFLAANPRLSKTELVERLPRGVSGLGLVMAIYEEAVRQGVVRETAKDLLVRKINERFPNGWSSSGDVSPLVKLGFWEDEIREYIRDPITTGYANNIMRQLTMEYAPPEGWKPEVPIDRFIDDLFDRNWPLLGISSNSRS
jgi:hypothetical protein